MLKLKRRKRGQSTLEYIAVFVAVVAAIVVAVAVFRPAVTNVVNSAAAKVDQGAGAFSAATIQ